MSQLKIGFVGLGDQGAPMAEAISEAGFELHVVKPVEPAELITMVASLVGRARE